MYASGSRKPWQQPGRAGGSLYRNTLFFGHLSSEKKQNANCGDKQGNINAFYISLCLSPRFTFCYLCTKMCRWTELAVQTLSCLPLPKFLSSTPPPRSSSQCCRLKCVYMLRPQTVWYLGHRGKLTEEFSHWSQKRCSSSTATATAKIDVVLNGFEIWNTQWYLCNLRARIRQALLSRIVRFYILF